jgi:hypothetical protein
MYVFVISSLNHPIYRKIQKKRKRLFEHYDIPYTVLINENESQLDDKKIPTLIPLETEEVLYNGGGYNPYMAQKFLMAVKMMFRSFPKYEDIPNYIVRINATVYVHYPSLQNVLADENFPKERVLAGPNWGDIFVQGMVMVFSKDVLRNMLNDPRMYSKEIMRNNDDVSLSILADPYSKWIDWNQHTCYMRNCLTDDHGVYQPEKFKPLENKKWIFRICEYEKDRKYDVVNWDVLLKYFNELEITSTPSPDMFIPERRKTLIRNLIVLVMILVIVLLFGYGFRKYYRKYLKTKKKNKI